MVHVVLERKFTTAMTPADFDKMAMGMVDCLPLYRATWHESLLGYDDGNLLCVFEAPDAESIRMVSRNDGAQYKVAWQGTLHDIDAARGPNVVVERRFDEPVTVEEVQALEDAGAWCMDLHNVTFLRTYFSTDRKRMICLYQAPDAESVRLAQRQAKMPVERVWACRHYSPAHHADS